jgi:hypothetical protein
MMAQVQQRLKQHAHNPRPYHKTKQPLTTPKTQLRKNQQSLKQISKSNHSPRRFNVCRLLFFSSAAATAAAPAAPTELPDDGAGSAAPQATRSQPTPIPQNKTTPHNTKNPTPQ